MGVFWARLTVTVVTLLGLALPGFAAQLDDYYLEAFGAQHGTALEKALLLPSTGTGTTAAIHCGTPVKHALSRDWNKLQASTQKVLASQLASPTLPSTYTTAAGHFRIHYATSGSNAPNLAKINQYTNLNLSSISDWVATVGDTFETAYSYYQDQEHYRMPPSVPYDVYLDTPSQSGALVYGLTNDLAPVPSPGFPHAAGSFIEINKDFTDDAFTPLTYTPLQSLQVTSAHEFHHAIQYGYNFYFEFWFAEATSTWYEDEVWPTVNQNYDYLPGWFNFSTRPLDLALDDPNFGGQAYGRWIFDRFLTEKHGNAAVRAVWEGISNLAPGTGGTDIPMIPVLESVLSSSPYNSSLGADFFAFAKRVYQRDWPTSAVITSSDVARILDYAPVQDFAIYPISSTSLTLPHYSFAYYRFMPSASNATLTLSLAKTSGIQATVFKKSNGTISEVAANADGSSYTVSGFNAMNAQGDEVTLLLANTTGVDGHQASFSSEGTAPVVQEPTGVVSASSPKSGCFIATAAFGSYLHPKVALLRAFRDEHLLTNAPGRLFVALYYRVSPPIADLIARHAPLRGMVRLLLAPVILAVEHGRAALLLLFLGMVLPVGWRLRKAGARRRLVAS
jgi:hypothetical protein